MRVATIGAVLAGAILVAIMRGTVVDGGEGPHGAAAHTPWRPAPHCRVTIPNGHTPPGERRSPDHHGNGKLWTALARDGRFTVAHRSSPEYMRSNGIAVDGLLMRDGSVVIKAPWWRGRGVRGRIRLQGWRLDAAAPAVNRAVSPRGYGLSGFQAMSLNLADNGLLEGHGKRGKRIAQLRDPRLGEPGPIGAPIRENRRGAPRDAPLYMFSPRLALRRLAPVSPRR